jgi:HNH endonuclease
MNTGHTETKTCIYCLERKPETEFNREHVVPQAFGTFDEDNLVLDCVCRACNQYLGDTIDRKLARDSIEGLDRFWSGMKPTSEFKSYGRKSTTFVEFKEGPMAGIRGYLHPNPKNAELRVMPLPHIGFAQEGVDGGRIRWFLADEIPEKAALEKHGFVRGRELQVHVREMSWQDATTRLAPKGYEPLSDPELTQPRDDETLDMDTIVTIGRLEQRAVAKIAFNYLAWAAGAALARATQFNDVRNFIRYDKGVPPVHPTENVLGFRMNGKPVAKGHYLAVQTTKGGQIVGDVCLMLRIRYTTILSDVPFAVSRPILSVCHLFDIQSRKIQRVAPPPPLFGERLKPYLGATKPNAGGD